MTTNASAHVPYDTNLAHGHPPRSPSPNDSEPPRSLQPAYKNRDPARPKRKKARRACAACQRAHLTCGDERPCVRCVKRGLQDDCHDGARKKAKYLRDAPDDALKPGPAPQPQQHARQPYSHFNGSAASPALATAPVPGLQSEALSQPANGFHDNRPSSMHSLDHRSGSMHRFSPLSPSNHGRPSHSRSQDLSPYNSFLPQPSPLQNQYAHEPGTPLNTYSQPFDGGQDFTSAFLDPADSTLFGYDTSSLNFGNQYGALEFVTLGHMAQAANNPTMQPHEGPNNVAQGQPPHMGSPVGVGNYPFPRHGTNVADWQSNNPRITSWTAHGNDQPDTRHDHNTYTIGAHYTGLSPASTGDTGDFMAPFESTPDDTFAPPAKLSRAQSDSIAARGSAAHAPMPRLERAHRPNKSISRKLEQVTSSGQMSQQRRRNAAKIYSSIIRPYPYTARFHALIATIQRRFRSTKRLRIAKALASIRPSLISCTRTLIDEDLVLMEKNFQRSLIEYRDYVSSGGTPTIICRRTGEVAYCGESFLLLSGWPLAVLLGREPNLNMNRPDYGDAAATTTNTTSMTTTSVKTASSSSSRGGTALAPAPAHARGPPADQPAQPDAPAKDSPVFLSDLLDDDSVIHFYEDFAKIAFADSKGSARRRCKLIKYRASREERGGGGGGAADDGAAAAPTEARPAPIDAARRAQRDISRLGEDEATVDCMFTWTVKRDVFEFPMMVVINFLPVLEG